jgi:ElaB/YqjD/DUF883 family membrane-anchored ribosome-binding protein
MAEERTLATARAAETAGEAEDPTKAELQRRMEEARESITQTVSEIKETVSSQYQNVRETISQSLDWREQFRRRPAAFVAGAVGVGFVVGYSVGGALSGDDEDELTERYYEAEGDYDDLSVSEAAPRVTGAPGQAAGAYGSLAYAASPASAPYGSSSANAPDADSISEASSAYQRSNVGRAESAGRSRRESFRAAALGSLEGGAGTPSYEAGGEARPSYSSGYESSTAMAAQPQAEEPAGPGLFERFRETQAYDRLQREVSALGARAVEELSKTAQNVVLPALLGKLKDMIGLDLSTQREVAQRSRLEQQTTHARAQADNAAEGSAAGAAGTGAYRTSTP